MTVVKNFKYIDLFSGVGGFHQAMTTFGGECVFASEIDQYCIETYKDNYNVDAANDITKFGVEDIPEHDVLCAGFPCQSFSKAGKQNGFSETRGTLFYNILEVLSHHKTQYIILENVRNLVSHDKGYTWMTIQKSLRKLGYRLTESPLIISPHHLGIPQLRERVFIIGVLDEPDTKKILDIDLPEFYKKTDNSIYDIVSGLNREHKLKITEYEEYVLSAWNEFYKGIIETTIGFPIWTEFFNEEELDFVDTPYWKEIFIRKNQEIYSNNKKFIDSWLVKYNYLEDFRPTHRKFEWQAGTDIKDLWEGIIQFRPSGIRVKRPDVFPTLVAMVHTPIIGRYKRRISLRETANIQSFPASFKINKNAFQAYKQMGNSVNVEVIRFVSSLILPYAKGQFTFPKIKDK